jgi:hypothetical protein
MTRNVSATQKNLLKIVGDDDAFLDDNHPKAQKVNFDYPN